MRDDFPGRSDAGLCFRATASVCRPGPGWGNRSRSGEERWSAFAGVVGLQRSGQVVEYGSRLLAAGFDHRQDGLDKAAAWSALGAEG